MERNKVIMHRLSRLRTPHSWWSWLIALAVVAVGLPAGTRRPAVAAPVTVTYLSTQGPADIQALIDLFNKTHPGIHVVEQNLPFDQLFQQVQVRLSAGSASPDIIDVDAPVVAAYAVQGFLAPLDTVFSKQDLAQFVPASLQTSYYLGHLLAPPLNSSSQVLYYNKDLLKKAGVPFPSADVRHRLTWEQLSTEARKAQVRSGGRVTAWGLIIDQIDRPYQLLPLPESLGGQAISKDGLSVDGIITSAPWVKAFTYYSNLFNTWQISPKGVTSLQTANLFTSGHAAFFWGGPWNVGAFTTAHGLHWGIAPTPYFAGGKPVTPNDSWHLGINSHSHNVAADAQFIHWMTVGPGNDVWENRVHQVPSLKREIQAIAKDPRYATFPNNVLRLVDYEAEHTAIPRPITPGFSEYQNILTQAFDNMRSGQSAQAALSAAASQIDSAMLKYRRAPH